MIEKRRAFLRDLGLGVAGVSLLALPGQALAFGRKRRVPCDVVPIPSSSPSPILPVEGPRKPRPELLLGGDIQMSFPLDGSDVSDPYIIYGNGTVCTWGKWGLLVIGISSLTVVDVSGNPIASAVVNKIQPDDWLGTCKWGYVIKGVPTGQPFSLKIVYGKLVGMVPTQQPPVTFSFFQCSSAFGA